MKRISTSDVASGVLAVCAVLVVAMMARREFGPDPRGHVIGQTTHQLSKSDNVMNGGHRIGSDAAPVVIVEFADFQCPVCASFEKNALRPIQRKFGSSVAVQFRHWPLSYHKFAYPAAKAAECAGAQGRFGQFHDRLYDAQDSLGLIPFPVLAAQSGVADTQAFARCISIPGTVPSIEADTKEVLAIKGSGTPTLIVGRTVYEFAPDSAKLDSIVQGALSRVGRQRI